MRAFSYLLFDPQAPATSPFSRASQRKEIVQYCQREAHTLAQVFTELAQGQTRDRPALHQLFQHLEGQAGRSLIVVTNPLHLGSTPEEAMKAIIAADALGSRVVCTTPGLPDPIQGLLRILTTTGRHAERRQRIRASMQAKALRGQGLGKPPYGYRIGPNGKLAQLENEAELVRRIFHLYLAERIGVRTLAKQLNQDGFRTRRGGNWSMVTIRDILRNRVYIGTYHRFGLRTPGNHPPLVSPDVFRGVQELMESRSPRRRSADFQPFLFSGLAYCAQCGNRMIGVTRRQTWRRKNGQTMHRVYRYYQCQSRTNQSVCRYHTWSAAHLQKVVEDNLRQDLQRLEERGQQVATPHPPPTFTLEQAAERRSRRFLKYLRQAASGAISLQRFQVLLDKLPNSSLGLEPKEDTPDTPTEALATYDPAIIMDTSRWESMDLATQRTFLLGWISRIEVGDHEARVHLHQPTNA